jgi:hypothetical protein
MLALGLAAIVGCADLAAAVPGRFFVNSPGPATSAGPELTGDHTVVLTALRARLAPGERIAADANLPPAWSGFAPVWQISDANGFQPQFSKYQLARVQATGASFHGRNRTFPIVPRVRPYLVEMDVRYVVVRPVFDHFARAKGYTRVFSDSLYRVYRVDGKLERAYAVDPACLRRLGPYALTSCVQGPLVSVRLQDPSVRRLRIGAANGVPLLVTGEPWYPGWQAQSAKGALPVHRVGYLAAVTVPPGVSEVTLSYDPPGLEVGALLSVLAIGGSLIVLVRDRRRRRLSIRTG